MKPGKPGIFFTPIILLLATASFCICPSFRAGAQTKKPATTQKQSNSNTHTKSASKYTGSKMGDIDQQDIDKAMQEVDQSMKNFQDVEWPKAQQEINKAIKEIDAQKIQQQIESAMKEVDMKAVKAEIEKAMNEVNRSLKEVDAEKIQHDVAMQLNNVNMTQLEKQIAEVKKMNIEQLSKQMAEMKEQMTKMKVDLKDQLSNAGEQMNQAKKQLELTRQGLDELEKDGLKKKGEKVNIEYRDGILYLDGNPQSRELSDKYKQYFDRGDNPIKSGDTSNQKENEPLK